MILLSPQNKILTGDSFIKLFDRSKKLVFTNGCFDIIHVGHVDYLLKARNLGDALIIGLNSDDSVKRLKGPTRPVNDVNARAFVLASLYFVDYVVVFDEDTPLSLIQTVKPDILVKGGDYSRENIVGADFVESSGGNVVVIPFVDGYSTTSILNRLSTI